VRRGAGGSVPKHGRRRFVEMVPGISNHPHAKKWHPGAGGLCLHTILREGNRLHIAISAGGHYLSEDGATRLQPATAVSARASCPTTGPSSGSAFTRSRAQGRPGRLYMQNHGGCPDLRTAAFCAATISAARGARSARGCRPISDFRWWSIARP